MDGDGGFEGLDSGQQQQGDGGNPAWQDFLNVIPQELHSKVTPVLQQWDKGVQDRFQKVHQEYEPWKPVIKNSDPETVQFAMQMLSALENDPKTVYKAIGEFYKDQLGDLIQPTPGQGHLNKDQDDKPWMADLTQLKQENEMLAQVLTTQQQAQQNAAADAQLDHDLMEAKKKHGEYDENYVLGLLMANGQLSVDDAVQAWKQSVQNYAEKMGFASGPKPMFLGGGSAIPGSNVDLKQASDKETKDVVVQMLQAAAQQNKQ